MSMNGIGSSNLADMLLHMQEKMKSAFTTADADGSGSLSKSEFSGFDTAMRADAPKGLEGATHAPSADKIFSKMDVDGDGQVSQAEMEAFKPPMPADGMSALLQLQEDDRNGDTLSKFGGAAMDLTNLLTGGGSGLMAGLIQNMLGAYTQQAGGSTSDAVLNNATASTSVEA